MPRDSHAELIKERVTRINTHAGRMHDTSMPRNVLQAGAHARNER